MIRAIVVLLLCACAAAQEQRRLIIQGDLGMMHNINRAGFEALEKHWLTSATVLVAAPWFPEVARFAQAHPDIDYGLHLMLNSEWTDMRWGPVAPRSRVPSLVDGDSYFPHDETVVLQRARPEEVEIEFRAQIERARAAGIRFTHFDSHMGTVFGSPALFHVYLKLGREYGVPVLIPPRIASDPRFCTPATGNDCSDASLISGTVEMRPGIPKSDWLKWYQEKLAALGPGTYLVTFHVGYDDAEHRGATSDKPNWNAEWRATDWEVLSDPAFQQFLKDQHFALTTWSAIAVPKQMRH